MHDLSEYVRFKDLNAELSKYARRETAIHFDGEKIIIPHAGTAAKLTVIGLLVLAIKALL